MAQPLGSGRKQPLAGHVARLEKLGIEHQLQFAGLVFLVLAPPKLQKLVVGDEFQLARFSRSWRRNTRWCSCGGQRAEGTFPEAAVAQDPLDDALVPPLDEADDLHLAAAARAFQWIDFVHPPRHSRFADRRPATSPTQ